MTRILIVDDSSSTRQMVSFTLKKAGYEVMEAANEQEALEKAYNYEAKLVITHIQIPQTSGLAFIRRLRAVTPYKFTPILTLTNASDVDNKPANGSHSATGWLIKPFDSRKLLMTVTKALGDYH